MAMSWQKAQENEVKFWRSIYVDRSLDVPSYMPISEASALEFSRKSLERFGYSLDVTAAKVVADVGCGPYGLVKGFQLHAQETGNTPAKIYGIDPLVDTYLKFGTLPTTGYLEYIKAKAESLPLPSESCDFVFSTNVIDHVENPDMVLRQCHRVCKSGGAVLFSVHVVNFPFSLLGPLLFLFDKNHPHHFSLGSILRKARKQFRMVKLTMRVTIREDHPEFTLVNALRSGRLLRGLKRWLSTLLLSTCYVKCVK